MTINFNTGLPDQIYERPAMTPAQIEKIMALVEQYAAAFADYAMSTADEQAPVFNAQSHARAAVEAALRDAPQAEGWVMVPADVVKFLTGEGPLDGLWFGEHPFGLGGGKYWWRKHLHAARPSAPRPVVEIAGIDEYGPRLNWFRHWTDFSVGTQFYAAPPSAASDSLDAARYRQLVAMKDKAAPETIAHYVRNPAHLDRVIEVMEHQP